MKSRNAHIVATDAGPFISTDPQFVEPWVSKAQLMAHFGMGERTVERYVRDHSMPCHFVGPRLMRFKISEV